jgi:hypothetical protein
MSVILLVTHRAYSQCLTSYWSPTASVEEKLHARWKKIGGGPDVEVRLFATHNVARFAKIDQPILAIRQLLCAWFTCPKHEREDAGGQ